MLLSSSSSSKLRLTQQHFYRHYHTMIKNITVPLLLAPAVAIHTSMKGSYRSNTTSTTFSSSTTATNNTVIASAEAANALRLELPTIRDIGCRTKIVCTIGPATDTSDKVGQLVKNGMNVARLNFSHVATSGANTDDYYAYPKHCNHLIRTAHGRHYELTKMPIDTTTITEPTNTSNDDVDVPNLRAVLVDTKGPEIRTKGPLPGKGGPVYEIKTGDMIEIHVNPDVATNTDTSKDVTVKLYIDYENIASTIQPGGQVLLDDGLIALHVIECFPDKQYVKCIALNSGPIKVNKGVNLPNVILNDLPALTKQDCIDLQWAVEHDADYVAASFIRTPEHVRSVIAYLERCLEIKRTKIQNNDTSSSSSSLLLRPLVISKIESKEGVDNFHDILKESDGIMVARGDLGVEIPYSKVFAAQKMMIEACNAVGKPVIVATQMLDSMIRNPRPTRAEVTDVGTAVLDGADAVMLSGETAAGKYPIDSIKAMVSIVWEADQIVASRRKQHNNETGIQWNQEIQNNMDRQEQELDVVAAAAVRSAHEMNAQMIVVITMSGRVARAVARHRPTVPVLAFCMHAAVARRLQLHRSIYPVLSQLRLDPGSVSTRMGLLRAEAIRAAKELGWARSGDRIVFVDRTPGKEHDIHHFSHNMKVVTLRDS